MTNLGHRFRSWQQRPAPPVVPPAAPQPHGTDNLPAYAYSLGKHAFFGVTSAETLPYKAPLA